MSLFRKCAHTESGSVSEETGSPVFCEQITIQVLDFRYRNTRYPSESVSKACSEPELEKKHVLSTYKTVIACMKVPVVHPAVYDWVEYCRAHC